MKKRIIIVAMMDSVHTARWAEQFKDESVMIYFYPSRKFRHLHPQLVGLLKSRGNARYKVLGGKWGYFLVGYVDFIRHELMKNSANRRIRKLKIILAKSCFDYIHAMEIQGAGYLLAEIEKSLLEKSKLIVTNWGSDIVFYLNKETDLEKIVKVLKIADYYSAECARDYVLANQLGFNGVALPCIPNAGGFRLASTKEKFSVTSARNQIIVKGYGGVFGRVDLVIPAIELILRQYPKITVLFYSVSDDQIGNLRTLEKAYNQRISYSTIRKPLEQSSILEEFAKSRVYVGCSVSDGISTSFLQSLVSGAYPIQTNTSCAGEWIEKGAIATLIDLDTNQIYYAIKKALDDDQLVNDAQSQNELIAQTVLDYKIIRSQALQFYGL